MLCYLHTLRALPCFLHIAGINTTIILVGGVDGTGGLSTVSALTGSANTTAPE